eukprot:CAMPEP_0118894448 /NCGR_PEP_ID=MMETSP1166-20130328/3220_1 /TAXON_ID=1104430 /ORGANISM="Chrysoreinhardia sp, Strain CCMP3193" /LENGTH=1309 /DNA_ID=CAMNT_0006833357 /DNA_START=101 /DNA_END=4030 /DNA_ORIENTATION=+
MTMMRTMATLLAALLAALAAADPEVAFVSMYDVSEDSVTEGRCTKSGAFARDGRLMMASHLKNDGASSCDDAEPFVRVLRWDGEDWTTEKEDDLRKLPSLAAANDEFGGYTVLFGEPGDYDFEYWDEKGDVIDDHRNLDFDWELHRMVLLDDGRIVATTEDNRVLTFNWLNSAAGLVVDFVDVDRMSTVEFLASEADAVFVGGNYDDRRGVARLHVDGGDVTTAWQTPLSGATRGSPRVYLRKPRNDEPATEVLMVSQYFFARVDAATGELLFLTTESNVADADLVAYDAFSDSLYAYNDPSLARVNANDNSIVRSTDVSAPIDWADPAVDESQYGVSSGDSRFWGGDWYHKAEARDFDSLFIIDDDKSIHLMVTFWGTLGREEQLGTYVDWGVFNVDRSEFDYGDVGLLVEEEGGSDCTSGHDLLGTFTDVALVVAGGKGGCGGRVTYFVHYASLETEEVLWSASLEDRPVLVAANDARVAVLDASMYMKLWTEDGTEMMAAPLPIDGTPYRMVILHYEATAAGYVWFAVTMDEEGASVQTFEKDWGDYDRTEDIDLSPHDVTEAEFLAYDDGLGAYFVGGNYVDGRRAVTRFDFDRPVSTHVWTTPVDATSGSPRILLRRRRGAAAATEVLMVSQSFYARVDASSGDVLFVRTESNFANSDLVAYDSLGDFLYGAVGTAVVRYDVENGERLGAVQLGYQLDVFDPDMSELALPPVLDDYDLDNWYNHNGRQVVHGIGAHSGDCANHVHLFGRYYGSQVDEEKYFSWFLTSLDAWCDQDALSDERCDDDPAWHKRNAPSKDCAWVGDLASSRCDDVGDDGRAATVACRFSCGRCDIDGCEDSTNWFVKGQTSEKDCAWVAESAGNRCRRLGDDGFYAWQACHDACRTCAPLVRDSCASAESGFLADGDPSRDCDWVGEDPEDRCLEENLDGDFAFLGCPRQCGLCNVCFVEHVVTTAAYGVRSVLAVDLDGDGDLDLVAASSRDNTIFWYENNLDDDDDGFRLHNLITDSDVSTIAAADLDGDGDLDLVSTMERATVLGWYENTGDASSDLSFSKHRLEDDLIMLTHIATADIDKDGHIDIVIAYANVVDSAWVPTLAWYENDGSLSPSFIKHEVTTSFTSWTNHFMLADLDEDGDLDIAVAARPFSLSWFENKSGNFEERVITTDQNDVYYPKELAVEDLDGDGHLDIVSIDQERIAWFQHDGEPEPTFVRRGVVATTFFGRAVATADLDQDGHADVISGTSGGTDRLKWHQSDGNPSPSFTEHLISTTAVRPLSIAIADLDADGDPDIVVGDADRHMITWYENVWC